MYVQFTSCVYREVLNNLMKLAIETEENSSKFNFEGISEELLFFALPINLDILNILWAVYKK